MEKTQNRTDRRVVKTKKAIRNAFAALLSEKEVDQITVKEIADLADINRKTFYSYYAGVYQLVDEIGSDFAAAFDETMADVDFRGWLHNPGEIFMHLTNIISGDLEFYSHIMKMRGNTEIIRKVITIIKQRVKKTFAEQITADEDTVDLILDYTISGMIAVYQRWFHYERSKRIEDLSAALSVLMASGINGLLQNKAEAGSAE